MRGSVAKKLRKAVRLSGKDPQQVEYEGKWVHVNPAMKTGMKPKQSLRVVMKLGCGRRVYHAMKGRWFEMSHA